MDKDTPNISGYVEYVIRRAKKAKTERNRSDAAFCAVMRRAANPNTESAAWEYMVPFCDIGVDRIRRAFALVGAAIASEAPDADGSASVGQAFKSICRDEDDEEREGRRLRRLLACETTEEAVDVLRPMVRYVQDNAAVKISYSRLLQDLCYWGERTRIAWTKDFYLKTINEDVAES